jgi:hypothetical protein
MSDRISDDELAFHRQVLSRVRAIQEEAQAAINAVMGLWPDHLRQKYDLSEGDVVDEQGVIRRTSTQDERDMRIYPRVH